MNKFLQIIQDFGNLFLFLFTLNRKRFVIVVVNTGRHATNQTHVQIWLKLCLLRISKVLSVR